MRVFVTGATGFIGSAVTEELMAAGHTVTALARSEEAAKKLSAKGIQPILGNLDDMESLRKRSCRGGRRDPSRLHARPITNPICEAHGRYLRRACHRALPAGSWRSPPKRIGAQSIRLAPPCKGSGRPLVTTFGTMGLSHVGFRAAKPATEEDEPDPLSPGIARAKTEENVEALASLGVRATMIRLAPSVHGDGDTGLVPQLIAIARKKGRFAYVGDGQNRWPAVHRRDAARLFRLALEKGVAGARYHGVADEGIPFRSIAESLAVN